MGAVPTRKYIERVLRERDRASEIRFAAAQRALEVTAQTLDHRLEAMNEFRAQISNERALYVQRDQLTAFLLPIQRSVERLEQDSANLAGRFWALGAGVGFITLLLNIAVTVLVTYYGG